MAHFIDKVKELLLREKGIEDISVLEYREQPKDRSKYDTRLTRGNVNLQEGRFITKFEADEIVKEFLRTEHP